MGERLEPAALNVTDIFLIKRVSSMPYILFQRARS